MIQTATITRVSDVIRFEGTHNGGWPYEFWAALRTGDRLTMLAVADGQKPRWLAE